MELFDIFPKWILLITFAILVLLILIMAAVYIKDRKLEQIRYDVYQLILKAEHTFKESKQGKQKMKWVLSQARLLLPKWLQIFISEDTFSNIIQMWFDGVKDLLDDGKMNGSR